ncbi:hypothetical protein EHS25_008932 [Saitozyma podzolica]|uniref:Amidase domain-containing protein n=1 Tax=Saitozyma podzolica TaxID=1890683 RepID=A0A427YN64_9TREE|nr:hypothetical protein EHS25_008932 [Saitozyma podzolica]
MSHISLTVSEGNPVTPDVLRSTLTSLSSEPLQLRDEDIADYTAIMAGAHEVFQKIIDMEDYVPQVDLQRFSRLDVHRPDASENKTNAWAWKASIKGDTSGGLLAGRSVCLKDNIAVKDVPCLLGTEVISEWTPNTDATVVTRVLEAGGHITGKAVCENLSYFGASISAPTGPIHNVHAKGYSAGGSSTGCAVLVAAGECDLAVGGDQGGSIRLPAAHNGVVGMKPTHGLCPYTGIVLLESTIDTTGPITRNVLDNALLLRVMAGADGIDDRQQAGCPLPAQVPDYADIAAQGVKGLRIAIVEESLSGPLHDERYAGMVVEGAIKLEKLGANVERISIPDVLLAPDLWMVIARLSAVQNMTGRACGRRSLYMNDYTRKWLPLTQDKLDKMWPSAVATLTNGVYGWEHMDATLMGKTMNLSRRVRDSVNAALSKYDLLITPTMVRLPARIDSAHAGMTPLEKMGYAAGVGLNTCPYSLTGHPAISIPVGMLSPVDDPSARLPVGMQIVGKFYDEGTIYRAAYAWEQANDWTRVVGA